MPGSGLWVAGDRQAAGQSRHFIEVGEYGLALEEITGALAYAKVPVTDGEHGDMLALTAMMKLDGDLVPRALGFCPRAGSRNRGEDGELR